MMLIFVVFSLISCQIDIPEFDVTPPTFTFQIIGPGINRTYDQDSDYSNFQLNLQANATYNFVYSGSDAGGVKAINWQVPGDEYTHYTAINPSNATVTVHSPLSRTITLLGDINDPRNGLVMSGRFTTAQGNVAFNWNFSVKDYGGTTGTPNLILRTMGVLITETGPFGQIDF